MGRAQEEENRRLLRARDAIDRSYAQPLDVAALAQIAIVSEAHFIRTFKGAFGETPNRYLQRRRIERAMSLLRTTDLTVGEICVEVGFASVATFTTTFRRVVGETPTAFRARGAAPAGVPTCFTKAWTRPATGLAAMPSPSSFEQAGGPGPA
jgi:AraC-like DNA-binding protein